MNPIHQIVFAKNLTKNKVAFLAQVDYGIYQWFRSHNKMMRSYPEKFSELNNALVYIGEKGYNQLFYPETKDEAIRLMHESVDELSPFLTPFYVGGTLSLFFNLICKRGSAYILITLSKNYPISEEKKFYQKYYFNRFGNSIQVSDLDKLGEKLSRTGYFIKPKNPLHFKGFIDLLFMGRI